MDQSINPVPAEQKVPGKWSWGGFMLDTVVILGSKNYWLLLIYLLMLIPVVNILVIIVFKIYMGMKSKDMVMESMAFSNNDERRGFLKGVDSAGFILFIVSL